MTSVPYVVKHVYNVTWEDEGDVHSLYVTSYTPLTSTSAFCQYKDSNYRWTVQRYNLSDIHCLQQWSDLRLHSVDISVKAPACDQVTPFIWGDSSHSTRLHLITGHQRTPESESFIFVWAVPLALQYLNFAPQAQLFQYIDFVTVHCVRVRPDDL